MYTVVVKAQIRPNFEKFDPHVALYDCTSGLHGGHIFALTKSLLVYDDPWHMHGAGFHRSQTSMFRSDIVIKFGSDIVIKTDESLLLDVMACGWSSWVVCRCQDHANIALANEKIYHMVGWLLCSFEALVSDWLRVRAIRLNSC
jgi:hypothetical protein